LSVFLFVIIILLLITIVCSYYRRWPTVMDCLRAGSLPLFQLTLCMSWRFCWLIWQINFSLSLSLKWFCGLHIHVGFHLAKLIVMDEILSGFKKPVF